jgi:hypothetical protein
MKQITTFSFTTRPPRIRCLVEVLQRFLYRRKREASRQTGLKRTFSQHFD